MKLCECGCGAPAPIARQTRTHLGHVKGEPVRYIPGHARRGKRRPLAERFWEKVDRDGPVPSHRSDLGPCWLWTAGTTGKMRYGCVWDGARGRMVAAHIVAYELAEGLSVPEGLELDHLCRVPRCVRRSHLEPVTHQTNIARGDAPKRAREHRGEKNPAAKLTEPQVAEIRARYAAGGISQAKLADQYGVSQRMISFIVRGMNWVT